MTEFLNLALGLLTPFVVSWLKQAHWPDWAKALLTLGIALLAGVLTTAVGGNFDLRAISANSAQIFTVAILFYKTYFQNSVINQHLESGTGQPTDGAQPTPHV